MASVDSTLSSSANVSLLLSVCLSVSVSVSASVSLSLCASLLLVLLPLQIRLSVRRGGERSRLPLLTDRPVCTMRAREQLRTTQEAEVGDGTQRSSLFSSTSLYFLFVSIANFPSRRTSPIDRVAIITSITAAITTATTIEIAVLSVTMIALVQSKRRILSVTTSMPINSFTSS